jgi:hypothetical protein
VRLADIPSKLPPAPGARFSYVPRPIGRGVEATQVFAEGRGRAKRAARSADELLHEFIRHRR